VLIPDRKELAVEAERYADKLSEMVDDIRLNKNNWMYRQTNVRKDCRREGRNATYQARAKRETTWTVRSFKAGQGDKNLLVYWDIPETRSASKGLCYPADNTRQNGHEIQVSGI